MTTQKPAERPHHKVSPSKLNYLEDCPGFVNRPDDGPNEAAEEGTMLHDVCQNILESWPASSAPNFMAHVSACLAAAFGFDPLSESQKQSVRAALKPVGQFIDDAVLMMTEEKLTIVNPDGSILNYGYVDVILVFENPTTGRRWAGIFDFKFGWKPVRHASDNLQGIDYALAFFQADELVDRIYTAFIQPRISGGEANAHWFERKDMSGMYGRIRRVVEASQSPNPALNVGDNCAYCAKAGNCSALAAKNAALVKSYYALPDLPTFHGSQISRPEDMAAALWIVTQAEPAIKSVKKAALEMARSGFTLETQINGEHIQYELKEKRAKVQLGESALIFDAIKDVVAPESMMGAVSVNYGDLEKIFVEAYVEKMKADGEKKVTKKSAAAELATRLEAAGLSFRPDVPIQYLTKLKQQETSKTIEI